MQTSGHKGASSPPRGCWGLLPAWNPGHRLPGCWNPGRKALWAQPGPGGPGVPLLSGPVLGVAGVSPASTPMPVPVPRPVRPPKRPQTPGGFPWPGAARGPWSERELVTQLQSQSYRLRAAESSVLCLCSHTTLPTRNQAPLACSLPAPPPEDPPDTRSSRAHEYVILVAQLAVKRGLL